MQSRNLTFFTVSGFESYSLGHIVVGTFNGIFFMRIIELSMDGEFLAALLLNNEEFY